MENKENTIIINIEKVTQNKTKENKDYYILEAAGTTFFGFSTKPPELQENATIQITYTTNERGNKILTTELITPAPPKPTTDERIFYCFAYKCACTLTDNGNPKDAEAKAKQIIQIFQNNHWR